MASTTARVRVPSPDPRAEAVVISSVDVVQNWSQFGVHFAFRVALETNWRPKRLPLSLVFSVGGRCK